MASATDLPFTLETTARTAPTQFDQNGYGLPQPIVFGGGPSLPLTAGVNLFGHSVAGYAGKIVKWKAIAEQNPAGGGFTFDILRNGTSIFPSPQTAPAGTTAVQSGSVFAATVSVAENDTFTCNIDAVGSGVVGVKIYLYLQTQNQ